MEKKSTIRGLCPQCSNLLDIPAGLEEFSCLYCGIRLTPVQLLAEHASTEPIACTPEEASAALDRAVSALVPALTGYADCISHLTRSEFPDYFARYRQAHSPALEALDRAIRMSPEEDCPARAAERLISAADDWAEAQRGRKDTHLSQIRTTVCLLLVPTLRQLRLSSGEAMAKALHSVWLARYPKLPFQLTTWEEIAQGFQTRKWCFITSAACRHLGKADDCRELTAFRRFRDGYLSACPDGPGLIREYYNIAPGIVAAIDLMGNPEAAYTAIWADHLTDCLQALDAGDNEGCKARYCAMVRALQKQYLTI